MFISCARRSMLRLGLERLLEMRWFSFFEKSEVPDWATPAASVSGRGWLRRC